MVSFTTTKKRYIANQIVHHSKTPNVELLIQQKVKIIFLIRQPKKALSSIILFSLRKKKPFTQDEAVEIYCKRLNSIAKLSSSIPNENWAFITYENLIQKEH